MHDPKAAAPTPERILVVDDDAEILASLDRSLRRLGYAVTLASDGREGLEQALKLHPNVVLTDIHMPGLDGHTLIRRLAAHDADTAVVVMSAHGSMDDVIDVLHNGAVDYLKKPWSPTELVSAVVRAAEIHVQRVAARAAAGPRTIIELPLPPPDPVPGEEGAKGGASVAPVSATIPAKTGDASLTAILDRVRRGEIQVPAVPAIIAELRVLLKQPEAAVDRIVTLIEREPRLAAQVLRLANAAQYARGGHSNDLRNAVSRVGFEQLQSLVETAFAHGCFMSKDAKVRALQGKIWRYSVARAVAMRALADVAPSEGRVLGETAYVAGLLCDVGAMFLLWLLSEQSSVAGRHPADANAQQAVIREHHANLGGIVLSKWGSDPEVVLLSTTHHADAPPAPPSPYWYLEVLSAELADQFAAVDPTRSSPRSPELVDRAAAELRIGVTLLRRVREKLAAEFDQIVGALA